jgi:hypothetical protein
MSNLLSRILLAIIMFPLATIAYFVVFVMVESWITGLDEESFLLTTVIVGSLVAVYWLLLWRRSVRWTAVRSAETVGSVIGCVLAGLLFGVVIDVVMNEEVLAIFLGGVFAIILWLAVSVLIWRETPAERAERIRQNAGDVLFCPKCGYNMTGLYESRCPECGSRYTLDQLLAAQRQQTVEVSDGTGERLTE